MTSPTGHTLRQLRDERYIADVCERWIPGADQRADLFRAFDVVAIRADVPGVLGVQTTSGSNHASRVRKLRNNTAMRTWLAAGNKAEVWSWSRDHAGRWTCRRAALALKDLEGVTVEETPRPKRRGRRARQRDLFDAVGIVSPETHAQEKCS